MGTSFTVNDKKNYSSNKMQPNIDQFLQKLHHRVTDSV